MKFFERYGLCRRMKTPEYCNCRQKNCEQKNRKHPVTAQRTFLLSLQEGHWLVFPYKVPNQVQKIDKRRLMNQFYLLLVEMDIRVPPRTSSLLSNMFSRNKSIRWGNSSTHRQRASVLGAEYPVNLP